MNPIRPSVIPTAPASTADTGKLAAQKAFFAALNQPAAAPASTRAAPVAAPSQPAIRNIALPAEEPTKILRPGSLIDIRV